MNCHPEFQQADGGQAEEANTVSHGDGQGGEDGIVSTDNNMDLRHEAEEEEELVVVQDEAPRLSADQEQGS